MNQKTLGKVAVGLVAAVAATISFDHMRVLAENSGEDWKSWLLPLSVDGMLIAASLAANQAKQRKERVPGLTVFAIGVGILISVAANVLSSFKPEDLPAWLPGALAAWPPLALALAFEEGLKLRKQDEEEDVPEQPKQQVLPEVPDTAEELTAEERLQRLRNAVR